MNRILFNAIFDKIKACAFKKVKTLSVNLFEFRNIKRFVSCKTLNETIIDFTLRSGLQFLTH